MAYTYEADTHCPPCAIARFGTEPGRSWVREVATDSEGNPVGAVFSWEEWHETGMVGRFTLVCGTCSIVIDECRHGPDHELPQREPVELPCQCDSCRVGAGESTVQKLTTSALAEEMA